jgi:hypothetical protein
MDVTLFIKLVSYQNRSFLTYISPNSPGLGGRCYVNMQVAIRTAIPKGGGNAPPQFDSETALTRPAGRRIRLKIVYYLGK